MVELTACGAGTTAQLYGLLQHFGGGLMADEIPRFGRRKLWYTGEPTPERPILLYRLPRGISQWKRPLFRWWVVCPCGWRNESNELKAAQAQEARRHAKYDHGIKRPADVVSDHAPWPPEDKP